MNVLECPDCGDEIFGDKDNPELYTDGEAYKCAGCKQYFGVTVDEDGEAYVQEKE